MPPILTFSHWQPKPRRPVIPNYAYIICIASHLYHSWERNQRAMPKVAREAGSRPSRDPLIVALIYVLNSSVPSHMQESISWLLSSNEHKVAQKVGSTYLLVYIQEVQAGRRQVTDSTSKTHHIHQAQFLPATRNKSLVFGRHYSWYNEYCKWLYSLQIHNKHQLTWRFRLPKYFL